MNDHSFNISVPKHHDKIFSAVNSSLCAIQWFVVSALFTQKGLPVILLCTSNWLLSGYNKWAVPLHIVCLP